jgi:hypothetical protein
MTSELLAAVDVELDTLRHLLAAAHLCGCADWTEASNKADEDVRFLVAQIPAGDRRVEVDARVLGDIADAAKATLAAHTGDRAPWKDQLVADLQQLALVCPGPVSGFRLPTARPERVSGAVRPAPRVR